MKVVFKDSRNTGLHDPKRDILYAFAEGVESAGDTLVRKLSPSCHDGDVLVVWNGLKGNLKKPADHFRKAKKPVVILETPLLNRDVDPKNYSSARVGVGHICYQFGNFNLPARACSDRLKSFGIEFQPWRQTGEHIIIAMQLSDDASLCNVNVFAWLARCVERIRQYTSRPIVIKSHPMIVKKRHTNQVRKMESDLLKCFAQRMRVKLFESEDNGSRFDILKNCWAVVCLTSGLAIDCVIKGIPTIITHPGNFMAPIQSRTFEEIESPKIPDREPWFNRLAYAQWNREECCDGTAWQHIRQVIGDSQTKSRHSYKNSANSLTIPLHPNDQPVLND